MWPAGTSRTLDAVDRYGLAKRQRLERPGAILTVTHLHDFDRLGGRKHGAMARARMIAVPMRDHRAVHRTAGVDIKIAGLAINAGSDRVEPGVDGRC